MTIIDTIEKEAFALMLRSKTALGRLTDPEVHAVLAFLESIGFKHHAAPAEPAPILEAPPVVEAPAAPPVVVEPIEPPPVELIAPPPVA